MSRSDADGSVLFEILGLAVVACVVIWCHLDAYQIPDDAEVILEELGENERYARVFRVLGASVTANVRTQQAWLAALQDDEARSRTLLQIAVELASTHAEVNEARYYGARILRRFGDPAWRGLVELGAETEHCWQSRCRAMLASA